MSFLAKGHFQRFRECKSNYFFGEPWHKRVSSFQIGKPGDMKYTYTALGMLVIFFPVVGLKFGSQPLQLPAFSFLH